MTGHQLYLVRTHRPVGDPNSVDLGLSPKHVLVIFATNITAAATITSSIWSALIVVRVEAQQAHLPASAL